MPKIWRDGGNAFQLLLRPEDVIEDLKRVAPMLGFSGYQALIKAYMGQGLRADLQRLESSVEVSALIKSLRKKGLKKRLSPQRWPRHKALNRFLQAHGG